MVVRNNKGLSSVVALHVGALGDFVLTHHVLARLRSKYPKLRIDVVARSPFAQWAAGRGVIETAHDYETFGLEQLFDEQNETWTALTGKLRTLCRFPPPAGLSSPPLMDKLRGYDLVLNFMGGDGSAPASALQRAGVNAIGVDPTLAPGTIRTGFGAHSAADFSPGGWTCGGQEARSPSRRHITEQWMDALAAHGLPLADHPAVELRVGEEERRSAGARLVSTLGADRRPRVIVHPGSGSRAKCCPVEKLEEVVGGLLKRACGVVWMVGPTEWDWYGPDWIARLRQVAPVVSQETVASAAALVLGADLYVGHDAGMTHVAAAVGVRTVALFGPTEADVWSPLGPCVTTVQCDAAFERPDAAELLRTALPNGIGIRGCLRRR
jgi:ADP-heptose:LPS heptosyltransferase